MLFLVNLCNHEPGQVISRLELQDSFQYLYCIGEFLHGDECSRIPRKKAGKLCQVSFQGDDIFNTLKGSQVVRIVFQCPGEAFQCFIPLLPGKSTFSFFH